MKDITELDAEIYDNYHKGEQKRVEELDEVTVRFAGDSGDGMQLTGSQFSATTGLSGNVFTTFPDFPAEIRAPQGTVAGVSGFQIHFSSTEVHTPGDDCDVLIAMNPAALKANYKDVPKGGVIIVNEDSFTEKDLEKAGYSENPLDNGVLADYHVVPVPITRLTVEELRETDLSDKDKKRSKNMFALGIAFWLFDMPLKPTEDWVGEKFAKKPELADANKKVLRAGYSFGHMTELLPIHFHVRGAHLRPGTYRNITGNQALSLGLIAASSLAETPLFLGSYPITPASDILHELSKHKNFRIKTYQAEDEIAAMGSAIGAAYSGSLAVTSTSGPGLALKAEAMNLAVMTELPILIIDVQRAGPSTGLPTKVEQSDLMQVLFGRNGESPVPVIAVRSPADGFRKAIHAMQIATKYMTPVVLLSDGYLANGTEEWKIPDISQLAGFKPQYATDPEGFHPYQRDENLSRPWVKPGTPGMEHRIGGLEKQNITGAVSYDPENHEEMVRFRAQKIAGIQKDIPDVTVLGSEKSDTLLVGWGSTFGAITDSRLELSEKGIDVDQIHIDYVYPFPANLEEVLSRYKRIIVVEMNLGQFAFLLQGTFGIKVEKLNKVQGKPFKMEEIIDAVTKKMEAK